MAAKIRPRRLPPISASEERKQCNYRLPKWIADEVDAYAADLNVTTSVYVDKLFRALFQEGGLEIVDEVDKEVALAMVEAARVAVRRLDEQHAALTDLAPASKPKRAAGGHR